MWGGGGVGWGEGWGGGEGVHAEGEREKSFKRGKWVWGSQHQRQRRRGRHRKIVGKSTIWNVTHSPWLQAVTIQHNHSTLNLWIWNHNLSGGKLRKRFCFILALIWESEEQYLLTQKQWRLETERSEKQVTETCRKFEERFWLSRGVELWFKVWQYLQKEKKISAIVAL